MNSEMEKKLKKFSRIICIDGTHGICKYKGYELTTVLIRDDTNAGFPVAFLVSNRKDQIIQEVFLGALKNKIGKVEAEILMTDDDRKYYNAWIKIMEYTPRRLLCSWHVCRNWNLQGKAKIKNPEIKQTMKMEMKKIQTATDVHNFKKLKEDYFRKLEEENEDVFLDYLKR